MMCGKQPQITKRSYCGPLEVTGHKQLGGDLLDNDTVHQPTHWVGWKVIWVARANLQKTLFPARGGRGELTFPNSNWSFPAFTNPFCYSSSQLALERPVQRMVSVLPKQLERLANMAAAAKMYKHLGNFPTRVRSSNSIKCDTNLSQSRENKMIGGDT